MQKFLTDFVYFGVFLLFILGILCLFFKNRLQMTLSDNFVSGVVFPQ